ncbi:MAG: exodeoxyribonuclease VII small subunit [Kiritimatiellia bacterium]|nr:exodeoxyribonuclease VII small subunit [Kiritimatiellia bacterium]
MTKKTDRNPNFEKALSELEAIVAAMESGTLPLEKMMEQYEEGMRLISFCSGKLNEVEKKIEIMVKKGDKVAPEPFDPEKAAENVKQE